MNHFGLLSPNLTIFDPVHVAITLAFIVVIIWIISRDHQGPEGRL